jgi:hypothetical protein
MKIASTSMAGDSLTLGIVHSFQLIPEFYPPTPPPSHPPPLNILAHSKAVIGVVVISYCALQVYFCVVLFNYAMAGAVTLLYVVCIGGEAKLLALPTFLRLFTCELWFTN